MPPRVAVIVPCYQDGLLAIEAVASIAEQEPVDVIVVDDGSTDPETLQALERLEVAGTRVLRQENAGQGAARTAGVQATDAPYIFPLDADDLVVPGALAKLADLLDANDDAAFAWGDYEIFGDYTGRYRSPSQFLPWSLTYVDQYPISSLVRRTDLDRAGGWAARGYEDWGLWLSFVELNRSGVRSADIVYRRRLHGNEAPETVRAGVQFRARHQELFEQLQQRHPTAFARRDELRRMERPSLLKRLTYPILFGRRDVVPYRVEALMQRVMMRYGLRLSR